MSKFSSPPVTAVLCSCAFLCFLDGMCFISLLTKGGVGLTKDEFEKQMSSNLGKLRSDVRQDFQKDLQSRVTSDISALRKEQKEDLAIVKEYLGKVKEDLAMVKEYLGKVKADIS